VDWLIRCQILPAEHVVAGDQAEVFEFAQLLRDGVILCHLANHLHPGAVDPKEFTLRPQMSQVCFHQDFSAVSATFGLR